MAKDYEQEIYSTTDLYLAAFLKAKKYFVRLKREGRQCHFTFIDDPKLQEAIVNYFNDGQVGVTSFKNALQDLKTLMFNA